MRVLLVGPDHESNLSLLYLAASLRAAGHEPEIVVEDRATHARVEVHVTVRRER